MGHGGQEGLGGVLNALPVPQNPTAHSQYTYWADRAIRVVYTMAGNTNI